MKFKERFSQPLLMSHGFFALSREMFNEKQAVKIIKKETGDDVVSIEKDFVKFSFPPDFIEDMEDHVPCWWTGAEGKGAKPIWLVKTKK